METAALQVTSAPTLSHMAATQRIIQEDNDDDAGYKVLTSLIYDIDCIFPTFSLNFFSSRCAVLGSWRVPVFLSRGAGICWGKPLSGQVKAHLVKLYLSSLSDRRSGNVIALQTVAPEKGNTSLKSSENQSKL